VGGRTELGEAEGDAGLPDARDQLAPEDDDGPAERHALPSVRTGGVPTTLSVMADITQDWGQRDLGTLTLTMMSAMPSEEKTGVRTLDGMRTVELLDEVRLRHLLHRDGALVLRGRPQGGLRFAVHC
jgi:hypothetical protein